MSKPVMIVGAGRQGRNILEILSLGSQPRKIKGFLDDTKAPGTLVDETPVLGPLNLIDDADFVSRYLWIVAIGEPRACSGVFDRLVRSGAEFTNAIHPMAVIASTAHFGTGVYFAAFVRLMPGSRVGDSALIEAGSMVGTDVIVGQGARLGPGARFLAGSRLGARSFAGAGSVTLNDISVGRDCRVGANAVVRHDVPDWSDALGVPAIVSARNLA